MGISRRPCSRIPPRHDAPGSAREHDSLAVFTVALLAVVVSLLLLSTAAQFTSYAFGGYR